jgi:hypothetical protein
VRKFAQKMAEVVARAAHVGGGSVDQYAHEGEDSVAKGRKRQSKWAAPTLHKNNVAKWVAPTLHRSNVAEGSPQTQITTAWSRGPRRDRSEVDAATDMQIAL